MIPVELDAIGGLYKVLGESALRKLVDDFYDVMDQDPTAAGIRKLHPAELKESRDKLFWFLTGRFGGPSIYAEKRGHPMLRARHAPFLIGPAEKDQWMMCMDVSIAKNIVDPVVAARLHAFFQMVADSMMNKESV